MLRNARSLGINPIHAARQNPVPPPPTKAELTLAFIRSTNRLGTHVNWFEVPGGVKLKLFDFAQGDAHVRADHAAALEDAAQFLLASPERRVWIIGHADRSESRHAKTLDWLSLRRAQRVWSQLAKRAVPKSQIISMKGHGIMGGGATLSEAAKDRDEPGQFRMVELLLMRMTLQHELKEQERRVEELKKLYLIEEPVVQ